MSGELIGWREPRRIGSALLAPASVSSQTRRIKVKRCFGMVESGSYNSSHRSSPDESRGKSTRSRKSRTGCLDFDADYSGGVS